jgi:flagellar M-ring protein FliF
MPDWLGRLFNDIANVWEKATVAQRALAAGITIAILGALVVFAVGIYVWPSTQLLAGGLGPQELGHLKGWLDEKGVAYDLGEDGSSVYVYQNPVGVWADYAMNAEDKPLGGYSVLINGPISQTREQFNETRLRAHQEELELGIVQGSDRIRSAKVFITPAQNRTFKSDSTKPTASVKVITEGRALESRHVQGIQWLVANSVPGMNPADVKVMNEAHEVLSGYEELSPTEQLTNEQIRAETAWEKKLVDAVSPILNQVTGGPENFVVSALVKLNWDAIEVNETYIDVENSLDTHVKREESEEKNQPLGGIPGETSNNPQAPETVLSPGGQMSTSTMESSEIETVPRVKRETFRKVAPGEIVSQQVSIAIDQQTALVDGVLQSVPRGPEEFAKLEQQLQTAVGHIADSTKYFFSLQEYTFDRSAQSEQMAAMERESLMRNIESGIFLVFALILVAVFFYFLRKVFSIQPEEEEPVMVREEVVVPVSPEAALAEFGLRPIEEGESLEGDARKSKMMREQIEVYAQEHPASVAEILRAWISE